MKAEPKQLKRGLRSRLTNHNIQIMSLDANKLQMKEKDDDDLQDKNENADIDWKFDAMEE